MKTPILSKTSLDWPNAEYNTEVEVKDERVHIKNSISNSDVLHRCLADGLAKWVTELRSPHTIFNLSNLTSKHETEIKFDGNLVGNNIYIRPLLCATTDFEMETGELHQIWKEEYPKSIPIDTGTILAEDLMWEDSEVLNSLFEFEVEKGSIIEDGELEVVNRTGSSQKTPFAVKVNENTMSTISKRDSLHAQEIWTGALAGVFAEILKVYIQSTSETMDDESNPLDERVFMRLREELVSKNILADDEWASFDCLKAATTISPYPIKIINNQNEDSND